MEAAKSKHLKGAFAKFFNDFRALFIKAFFLAIRNRGQTITEILLAYAFLGLLLGMRYILDRRYFAAFQMPIGRPLDYLSVNGTGDVLYYYPNNTCTQNIMNSATNALRGRWPTFTSNVQVMSDPSLTSVSNSTLQSVFAFVYFTNLDSCTSASSMPNEVQYTLRLQENGPYYYRPQLVKILENDYLWKRSPQDYCQGNSSFANYTNRFIGVQYAVDLGIIQYATSLSQSLSSSIYMNHFGCPEFYQDQLHSVYAFFIPIFFSIIFIVTFIITIGYVVEERQNKTKEYLRIYGLRTWINNLVWITRSMIIYFVLVGVVTGFSYVVLPSSGARFNSVSKALFNYTHWTLIWTILFVYSIHVSCFTVFFGQLFKQPLLAKLLGFLVWVLTFIDYYPGVPVGLRYFLCLFPNTGLMFCLQVVLQYERKGAGGANFSTLYSNLFSYQLYIGLCLLLMLIYSVIFFFLAIYVERVNPGEFGISQPWYYVFKKSYWKPQVSASVQPFDEKCQKHRASMANDAQNHWVEVKGRPSSAGEQSASLMISHVTKKFGKFVAVSDLSLNFYKGEVCSLLGHNGAGKTTTTFMLVGMLEATSGYISIEGINIQSDIQTVRKILGFCPQYDILYDDLSVEEHLTLIGKMRHLTSEEIRESSENILHLIGLTNDRGTLSKNLSGGMKRRLSIGISLLGDPKVLILDEPTSGIDPYNRRLIWSIIRKMKEAGKCVLLTTHFLEEADVLSDRIAIMSSGHLQAYGTSDYLKKQIEFEYRMFIDKQKECDEKRLLEFIRQHIPSIVVERESSNEMVVGILRNQSKEIGKLISGLDGQKEQLKIDSYGISMITIEEVFLKLIEEEEEKNPDDRMKNREELADRVFRAIHERITGMKCFWARILALLIKRFHMARREYVFLLGFFLLPVIIEIIIVAAIPTPKEIQVSLTSNERVSNAKRTFELSSYNPQTVVLYASSDANSARTRLVSTIQSAGATLDEISSTSLGTYVQDRYLATEETFINKYQMGFALYPVIAPNYSFVIGSYFSTVNYHTMPTSLNLGSTSLFQFYANSSAKKITTTNQPILTSSAAYTTLARFFELLPCFDTIPVSLFNFLNSILVSIFISVLIMTIIQERVIQSKDLQLLTNTSKGTYWFANTIFDFSACLIVTVLITLVIEIGAFANPKTDSEVNVYKDSAQMGYFFLMLLMYCIASIPLMYVYSYVPKTQLIGFITFFIINIIACFFDMVLDFIAVFSQAQSTSTTGATATTRAVKGITWVLVAIFPSVNFKHSLYNIRVRSSTECMSAVNSLMYTTYSTSEGWMSVKDPGLGLYFIIFCIQTLLWWIILVLIENGTSIGLGCRRCCKCDKDLEEVDYGAVSESSMTAWSRPSSPIKNDDNTLSTSSIMWNDQHLDEDVRQERREIMNDSKTVISSSVIVVRDLVQRFKKRKDKALGSRVYTAVDHLNFRVAKQSCFGLLGANGAGKTTTFRMLINDLRPTSGQIIINGKDIHQTNRDIDIGFCPQFDWLIPNLSVLEIVTLFARLKGLKWNGIDVLAKDMIDLFGLEKYVDKKIEELSGGNKRKVSSVLAFMGNPDLVFLDEPTTGLDAGAKRKLWQVIRTARNIGLTIVMTSHSMEECEALCTKIGIMKLGQFVCLGNLQRLKNRFGNGYAVQVKTTSSNINKFKEDMIANLPGVQIIEEHNGMLYCNVPYTASSSSERTKSGQMVNLAYFFDWFHKKNEEKAFESYAITQTTLEQIFVLVAGEDPDSRPLDDKKK